ncbi:MAG: tetratricopeptide repeat protein [Deltaproteobacteria bacterium]|nr:tetratricopeptide repeat protein [Deltaproteobacteria bacterium]
MRISILFLTLFLSIASCSQKEREGKKLYERAKIQLKKGNKEAARNLFFQAWKLNPDNEDGVTAYAEFFISKSEPRKASKVLATFLGKNDGKAESWYLLGYSRYLERKYENSVEALDEALKRKRKYPEAVLLLGQIYEHYQEWVAAKDIYNSVATDLSLGKGILEILVRLAALELKTDTEESKKAAEGHLRTALRISSKYKPAMVALGLYYINSKAPQKAEQLFRDWIKNGYSSGGNIYLKLGDSLLMQGKYNESIKFYKIAIKKMPESIEPLKNILRAFSKIGDRKNVWNYLLKASTMEPSNLEFKWMLVDYYLEKEMYITAYKNLEAIHSRYSLFPDFWRKLALVNEGMGDYPKAYENFMKILTLGGKENDLFRKRAGILARNAGLYKRAVEFLGPLLEKQPDNETVLNYCLGLYYSSENSDSKKKAMDKLIKLGGDNKYPMADIWVSHIFLQTGKRKDAMSVLEKLKSLKLEDIEKLFYLDVLSQYYHLEKNKEMYINTLKKALLLARNDEERNSLKKSITEAETGKKERSCGAENKKSCGSGN